jgi:dTDP-4-amino-4,6-dideoxygalactose transaminase
MINVTKTFFPPIQDYRNQIDRIWENEWLTNRGALTLELEEKLKLYLKVPNIILMNNGTIPLQIALKILGNCGEIITTPFSYIATTSSIIWENCTPVFVDINPEYLTIDENKIEQSITSRTTCILATHVFGNPCNVEIIEKIAKKYNLNVIYDAAHCFGVEYNGNSIFNYGNLSTCSFHATKLFHTGEGGALFTNDEQLYNKAFYSHNFGHHGPENFYGLGINGKISELQSAMGLAVFPYLDEIIEKRRSIINTYNSNISFNNIRTIKIREKTTWNNSYYPIIFESESRLLKVMNLMNNLNIFPRRYFYPSLNTISYINGPKMNLSEDIASKIICLPLSHNLSNESLEVIINLINKN